MQEQAKVIANRQLGDDVFLLRLEAPGICNGAKPGQFVMLRAASGLEPLLARPFSIHGVEGDQLLILYQVVGRGTWLLSQLKPGATRVAWGPLGTAFDLGLKRPVLVAGGMGIAPLAYAAEAFKEAGVKARLFWGVASVGGIKEMMKSFALLFRKGLEFSLVSEDGSAGQKGLVTDPLADQLGDCDGVLACGPLPMLGAVARLCAGGSAPCQVSLEAPMACGVGACLGCVLPSADGGYLRVCQEGPVLASGRVDWERV